MPLNIRDKEKFPSEELPQPILQKPKEKRTIMRSLLFTIFILIVLISVIVVTDEKSHTCALAEAEIGIDGKPIGSIKLRSIGSIPDMLTGGSILYAEKEGKLQRLDIVLTTENQGLYWSNADGTLRPISVTGIPTKPILLCPG